MLQITAVGVDVPKECREGPPTRITLRSGDLKLIVPDRVEDMNIRWLVERGMSLWNAYKQAGARYIMPDEALRPCIELVFKTPYYDPNAGEWKTGAGKFTCIGFHKCFEEYVSAQAAFPEQHPERRRMRIAPGVYAPSAPEEACIKRKFVAQVPLDAAYRQCGAGDIIPTWAGALQFIRTAFMASMAAQLPFPPLYEITKRSHQLYAIQPPPPVPAPAVSPPPVSPPPEDKDSKALYLVMGAVGLLILSDQ